MHKDAAQAVAPRSGMNSDPQTGDSIAFIPPSKHPVAQNYGALNQDIVEIFGNGLQDSFHCLIRKGMWTEQVRVTGVFESAKKNQQRSFPLDRKSSNFKEV
jgi:hypothetical protein